MTIKVHPAAEMFPMLSAEELEELAADIKANGLRQPITLDKDGLVVDGRNRLAACAIAKVKPEFATLNGEDPNAFIISQNLARRHMTPGQRAMAVAMMHPEPANKGGRGKTGTDPSRFPMVSGTTLKAARKVLRFASDLADGVLGGAMSLDKAYKEAKDREQSALSNEAKMEMLRKEARDLADLVTEGRMSFDDAFAAMHERKRKERETIEHGKTAMETGISRFVADVASIAVAAQLDDSVLDKKRIAMAVKAANRLQSLIK